MTSSTATLLISCPDQKGLVAKIANFIYSNGGNIIHADQHTDFAAGLFLTRLEWQLDGSIYPVIDWDRPFMRSHNPYKQNGSFTFSDTIPRIAIWVSQQDHC
jgi:formyltetrahydrofolate deformylase